MKNCSNEYGNMLTFNEDGFNPNDRIILLMDDVDDFSINHIIDRINKINQYDMIQEENYLKDMYDVLSDKLEIPIELSNKINIKIPEREPIIIQISSFGGSVSSAMALMNIMQSSTTPIITVNLSSCYSAAFMIFVSGHQRLAYSTSDFMYHNIRSYSGWSDLTQDERSIKHAKKIQQKMDQIIIKNTYIEQELLDSVNKIREDKYWDSDEAIDLGIVDFLIDIEQEDSCEFEKELIIDSSIDMIDTDGNEYVNSKGDE